MIGFLQVERFSHFQLWTTSSAQTVAPASTSSTCPVHFMFSLSKQLIFLSHTEGSVCWRGTMTSSNLVHQHVRAFSFTSDERCCRCSSGYQPSSSAPGPLCLHRTPDRRTQSPADGDETERETGLKTCCPPYHDKRPQPRSGRAGSMLLGFQERETGSQTHLKFRLRGLKQEVVQGQTLLGKFSLLRTRMIKAQ